MTAGQRSVRPRRTAWFVDDIPGQGRRSAPGWRERLRSTIIGRGSDRLVAASALAAALGCAALLGCTDDEGATGGGAAGTTTTSADGGGGQGAGQTTGGSGGSGGGTGCAGASEEILEADYYVAPDGDDAAAGDIDHPLATLNRAWELVPAGGLIYVRGGEYLIDQTQRLRDKNGTPESRLRVWAYPGERPRISPSGTYRSLSGEALQTTGLFVMADYVHLKGLELAGFVQQDADHWFQGIIAVNTRHSVFERLDVHHNGFGFSISDWGTSHPSADNLVLDSDFHHNSDPLTAIEDNRPWGGSDGLTIRTTDPTATHTIRGCRMWMNSDDGIDLWSNAGMVVIEQSWAFWNGFRPGYEIDDEDSWTEGGDGNGFKLGPSAESDDGTVVLRRLTQLLAFENRAWGFVDNAARCNMELFHNTAWSNGFSDEHADWCGGFNFTIVPGIPYFFRNNVAYANTACSANADVSLDVLTNVDHNSWDSTVTLSAADFVSLDSTGVDAPRRPGGCLPDLSFLHLADGSDLIDAGIDVGLPYEGAAPDLGAFERP